NDKKTINKFDRWNKIAKEAAEQCGRTIVPEISSFLLSFDEVLDSASDYDLALIPWEGENNQSLKETLLLKKDIKNILIIIGPEGGFSNSEIEKAKNLNLITVTLGKRILRTETAAMAILAMLIYEFEL
ncbi:MAG: RNA methyltransferase, partial [Elusimicrobia bacterium]|nr:RNA methyltransferase [Elusimicrobiota bacterium]